MSTLVRNQTRKTYSFKGAGIKKADSVQETVSTIKPPLGIKTPMEIGEENHLFKMHTDVGKLVSDNLRNLIMTNHGERIGFYDFGANLRPLVFELGSENADAKAVSNIRSAVQKYMPFVSLQNFQVYVDREDNQNVAKVGIQITYSIPSIDQAQGTIRSLELMLYMGA